MARAPSSAFRVALIYALLAGIWIGLSDRLVVALFGEIPSATWLHTVKGLIFVVVTAALLYLLVRREIERAEAADKELRNVDRQLETLVTNLPGMVYRCENQRDWPISYASEGSLDLTGYSPEELTVGGVVYGSLIHSDDAQLVWDSVQEALSEQRPFQLVYRIQTKDDEMKWVWEQGRGVFTPDGRFQYLEGFIMDISQRKVLEDQLQQSQRLEAVGRLAGGIAHDFNNLLTIIQGRIELVQRKLAGNDAVGRDMESILAACRRASAMTRQLLSVGRRRMLEPTVLDLNHVVKEVEGMVQRTIGEDIDLVTSYVEAPINILADAGQLEQILLNLVINARDAMPEGGRIVLETKTVEINEEKAKNRVDLNAGHYGVLAVSDTGMGMDEKTRERIFDPFFTTKDPSKGTGLGLATVYGIVKQLGGSIWVYSEPGNGSTFRVYFPLSKAAMNAQVRHETKPGTGKGAGRILLVEDNAEVRELARQVLVETGYTVLLAENGQLALDLIRRERDPVGLVISDVVMPEMSGPTLVDHLRKDYPQLRVLYISGYTDQHLAKEGVLNDWAAFLEKPFTPDELLEEVQKLLAQPGN